MKKNKLRIGDYLLVLGPHFFEKAEVASVDNGVFTLNNKIKITQDLVVLNNSKMEVKPFDEDEYNYLLAKNKIPRVLEKIESQYKNLPKEDMVNLFSKLNRVLSKYFGS